ncbi:MAG: lamin tail domain-containing protein [Candidatus Thermoplasmatota archaeon]
MKKALAILILTGLIGLGVGAGIGIYLMTSHSAPPAGTGAEEDTLHSVARIIDGDTIEIENYTRVRLIGIDAPESGEPFYHECTSKLSQLIGSNKVRLEKDVEDKDHYGRLLRYVWVGDLHVNLEMVRSGYATAYPYAPNTKYASLFESAEQEARNAGLGIWASQELQPSPINVYISYVHYDAAGNDWDNLNDEYLVITNEESTAVTLSGWVIKDLANHDYIFPAFTLDPGASVTLYTGSGTNTATALYWGSGAPIWNNDHDTAYLMDHTGALVDTYEY